MGEGRQICDTWSYLWIVWSKVCTGEIAPDPTEHIDDSGTKPAQTLLNRTQNKETEEKRQEQVDQSARTRDTQQQRLV